MSSERMLIVFRGLQEGGKCTKSPFIKIIYIRAANAYQLFGTSCMLQDRAAHCLSV